MKPIAKDRPIQLIKEAQSLPCRQLSVDLPEGPYTPITNADFAQWASGESRSEAVFLLRWFGSTKLGESFVEA
jgi:hypothetical protein